MYQTPGMMKKKKTKKTYSYSEDSVFSSEISEYL